MKLLVPLAALALSGCATFQAVAQRAAFPGAVGAETRVAANCIRDTEAGRIPGGVAVLVTANARDVFDVSLGRRLTPDEQAALARVRGRTDSHCPAPPVAAPPPVETPPSDPVPPPA